MATETLRPNEAGSETAIDFQAPASDEHWDKVDEVDADANTYIANSTSTTYKRDLYNLPAHSVGSGTINFIKIYFRCLYQLSGGVCAAKPSLKSNTTVTDGTEVSLTASWVTSSQQWNTNPASEPDPWTWDDIDALQIGVSLYQSEATKYPTCTQVYVEVDYTALPTPVADGDLIGIGIIRKS